MWIDRLEELIGHTEGEISLLVKNMDSGEIFFAQNEAKVYPACSLIKLPVLLTLLDEAAAGQVNLQETALYTDADEAGSCGLVRFLSRGLPLSWLDYALFMIAVSDNDATNKLISLVGLENVNSKIESLGLHNTVLGRKMMDFEAKRQGKENFTSCEDMLALFSHFNNHPQKYGKALGILKRQQMNNLLSGWLDLDEVEFAHKTGDLPGTRHDVGIMYLRQPIFVAFMSAGLRRESEGHRLANQIGLLIYENNK